MHKKKPLLEMARNKASCFFNTHKSYPSYFRVSEHFPNNSGIGWSIRGSLCPGWSKILVFVRSAFCFGTVLFASMDLLD
jgi:hypothetical protein